MALLKEKQCVHLSETRSAPFDRRPDRASPWDAHGTTKREKTDRFHPLQVKKKVVPRGKRVVTDLVVGAVRHGVSMRNRQGNSGVGYEEARNGWRKEGLETGVKGA